MSNKPFPNVIDLGLIKYCDGITAQNKYLLEIQENKRKDTLLMMEHHPTITIGRTSDPKHLLDSIKSEPKIDIVDTDRGGKVTFHGPGQLIVYPLLNIRDWGGPHKYIRTLETIIIATLRDVNVEAQTIPGLTGVWVNDEKIAAIGVKISRGVTSHGFAININTDLNYYNHIVPCGISDKRITSLEKILKTPYPINTIKPLIVEHLVNAFTFSI